MSSSRKPAHSQSRLKTMWTLFFYIASLNSSFQPIVKCTDKGLILYALHMMII